MFSADMRFRKSILLVLVCALPALGCQSIIRSSTQNLTGGIAAAVLDQDDPALVRDGAPAYLIAIDGMIQGDPENAALLLSGAQLYSAYASAFVTDAERAGRLTLRARDYGQRALCIRRPTLCAAADGSFDGFLTELTLTDTKDLPALYGFGSAWGGWIKANASDWNAIADLPKVEALMERILILDEDYERGAPHVYLGVLYTLRPASMGGKPELGRVHFERAVELSEGRDLSAKVLLASQYARLVFDRELHDRVLLEVLEADARQPGLTLSNTLAQQQAQELLAGADDYF